MIMQGFDEDWSWNLVYYLAPRTVDRKTLPSTFSAYFEPIKCLQFQNSGLVLVNNQSTLPFRLYSLRIGEKFLQECQRTNLDKTKLVVELLEIILDRDRTAKVRLDLFCIMWDYSRRKWDYVGLS